MNSYTVRYMPNNKTVDTDDTLDLLHLAQQNAIPIDHSCNGKGTCGKCKVKIEGACNEPTPQELKLLSDEQLTEGWRLACCCVPEGDMTVHVPVIAKMAVLSNGIETDADVDVCIQKVCLQLPQPSLQDQRGDIERVLQSVGGLKLPVAGNLRMLQELPSTLRSQNYRVSVTRCGDRLVAVEPGDTTHLIYGVAFDIGTTTIVGYLFHLESGEQCGVSSTLNPQTQYGGDVISRIEYASQEDGAETLRKCVITALNSLITDMCQQANIQSKHIYAAEIAGNTTMLHLALALPVAAIAQAPYIPVNTQQLEFYAYEVGLSICREGLVYFMPNIASYVGGDITSGILATSLDAKTNTAMLLDIGTNGEMVLIHNGKMQAAATAAGPCFEGGSISAGMRAQDGAISSLQFVDGTIKLETINGHPPRGLCGTGLVDLVSEMLRTQLLDDTGRLQSADDSYCEDAALLARIRPGQNGNEFVIVDADISGTGDDIVLTQRDIRQVQNAKAAVYAGILMLCKKAGITVGQIGEILLAGAFGNYIRTTSAIGLGLIPKLPTDRVISVGNAAGRGACVALLSRERRLHASDISGHVQYVELSGDAEFANMYADAMFFE